ncbi:MAG: DsrE family protein, partial [Bacteroidia bacterium]|nr:DsrE family protein [Bacteroidia bacterium]
IQKDHENVQTSIFLIADAVTCAISGQITPNGYYNIERMLKSIIHHGGEVKICGSCSEARGIDKIQLIDGVKLSNMKEFAQWTVDCDKVLTF